MNVDMVHGTKKKRLQRNVKRDKHAEDDSNKRAESHNKTSGGKNGGEEKQKPVKRATAARNDSAYYTKTYHTA